MTEGFFPPQINDIQQTTDPRSSENIKDNIPKIFYNLYIISKPKTNKQKKQNTNKNKDKEKFLNKIKKRETIHIIYREIRIKFISDFFLNIMQAKREENEIYKMLKLKK